MAIWHTQNAWLGGPDLTSDVLIHVEDGVISEVSRGGADEADVSLPGTVLPGLVSAHSHAFHRSLRGRTHDAGGDFWAWRAPMYEVANSLTPDSYRDLATAVFDEMLTAGITTVGEFHYVHHRPDGSPYDDPNAMGLAIIAAADAVGIRLTLLDTAYLRSSVAGADVLPVQVRFSDRSIGSWAERVRALGAEVSDRSRVQIGVAAHSVRGVGVDDLVSIAKLSNDLGLPLHIHASEQVAENEACLAEHGVTPVGLLASAGALGPATTLVHATHLTDEDIELIAASNSIVCFCPTTESDLGDGIGPAIELAEAGVSICLGSDSNAVIDVLHEANRLEQHDRLRLMRRGIHAPQALASMATDHGMRSLGWDDGGITVGAPADFISVDVGGSELSGTGGSLGAIFSAATRASVTDVIVGGVHRRSRV